MKPIVFVSSSLTPLRHCLLLLLLLLLIITLLSSAAAAASGGRWSLLQRSIGISAMHMQLLHTDTVAIFDRTDFGFSNISLPDGKCRHDPNERAVKVDCTAHSVEYNVPKNTFRPLMLLTDTWCSSGSVDANGTLVQTGGWNDGDRVVRTYTPCDTCDWSEMPPELAVRRWYSTNQILPDGRRAIIIGGRRQFNYEFWPKMSSSESVFALSFLRETNDANQENNLYPFVHLNIDGNLFIYANNRAILLDYKNNTVVRTYPAIPGGDPRNYPSSGSSVLLPLKPSPTEAEVLICGGAPGGSYLQARDDKFVEALDTCGRIKITDAAPSWTMETMPTRRVMGDMVLLPNGEVLIINGAGRGSAGWELATEPALSPVIYRPESPSADRFVIQSASTTPRLYHSSAILLRDGRVLVGGSNPHVMYNFTGVEFPTDLSLESFSPDYVNSEIRPRIANVSAPFQLSYGKIFHLEFMAASISDVGIQVTMVAPSFATHSFSMNQRLLVLKYGRLKAVGDGCYRVLVVAPATEILAPSGYYMIFVVNRGIPSEGIWARIS